jgi:hypothetical protein
VGGTEKPVRENNRKVLERSKREKYTDLTSRLLESRFFLDLGVEHDGGARWGKKEKGEVSVWLAGTVQF